MEEEVRMGRLPLLQAWKVGASSSLASAAQRKEAGVNLGIRVRRTDTRTTRKRAKCTLEI